MTMSGDGQEVDRQHRDRRISGPMHDQVIRVIRAAVAINGDGRDISSGDSDSKMLFICLLPAHVIHLCPSLNSLEIVNGPLLQNLQLFPVQKCAIVSPSSGVLAHHEMQESFFLQTLLQDTYWGSAES